MPSSCSFAHILHFSQPTQSMMRVMLWKVACRGGRGGRQPAASSRGANHPSAGQHRSFWARRTQR